MTGGRTTGGSTIGSWGVGSEGSWGSAGMGFRPAGVVMTLRASCRSCMVVCQVVPCSSNITQQPHTCYEAVHVC